VTGCPTHGPLVGGYVLGALDPGEMEEMRLHVAACPHCGPEADRLAALPELLDRIEPADVPPPTLSPQVEEAVLDRFARERGAASERRRRTLRVRRRLVAFAAAGLAAIALALALLWPVGGENGEPAYASVSLGGLAGAPKAEASAELWEVPEGTRIQLEADGLRGKSAVVYEVWCIATDGRWVSGGTFRPNRNGWAEAELTAAVDPGDYHRMVVTEEEPGDPSRGPTVLRGQLKY
jgi:Anti-sigma-K factor rskA/Putative zinc-finger